MSIIVFITIFSENNKEKKLLFYTIGLIFILFIGLRGSDDEYTKLFVMIPTFDIFVTNLFDNYLLAIAWEKGPILALVASVIKAIGLNSQSLLFSFALFSILIHLKYFHLYSKYYMIALMFYLSHEVIFHEYTQIRAGLASAMVLPMIHSIQLGKRKRFFILYILSFLIHYISLVSILILFLDRHIKVKWLFFGLLTAFVINFSGLINFAVIKLGDADLLPAIVQAYIGWDMYTYEIGFTHPKILQQIITSFILLIILSKRKDYDKVASTLINIYFLSTIFQIIFNDYSIFAFLLSGHFYVVEPIILTYLINIFKEKHFVLSISLASCILISYVNYVQQNKLEPYQFIIDQTDPNWKY